MPGQSCKSEPGGQVKRCGRGCNIVMVDIKKIGQPVDQLLICLIADFQANTCPFLAGIDQAFHLFQQVMGQVFPYADVRIAENTKGSRRNDFFGWQEVAKKFLHNILEQDIAVGSGCRDGQKP